MATGDRRLHAALAAKALVTAGTAAYVAAVYGLVVIGGGAVMHMSTPNVPLAVLATAVVAFTLEPLQRELRRRMPNSPADLFARFATRLGAAVATDEIAPRMAQLLAQATRARRVEVWLVRAGSPALQDLAARWPADADPIDPTSPNVAADEVLHQGELLGRLLRDQDDAGPLNPVEQRLVDALIGQAGVALRTVSLSVGLQLRAEQTTARAAELRASRQRIVASSDAARRQLERDVHDGAQQHLVALAVNFSLAATVAGHDGVRAAELIRDLESAAATALSTLEDLSRGVFPRLLTEAGPAVALRAATRTSPVPVEVLDDARRRFPISVEAAAYFACLEAVQNALKHAGASQVRIRLHEVEGSLLFTVDDNGSGFDPDARGVGTGLANITDRIESLGGTMSVRTELGKGTAVSARIPAVAGGG